MEDYILGISAYYHDSAAALVSRSGIIAAAQEERFSRKKHDHRFPSAAITYCLNEAGIELEDISYVVFYDKPLLKFERLLETYLSFAPSGFRSFVSSMPIWLKEKLFIKSTLKRELLELSNNENDHLPPLLFTDHHQAHAASAFYPSPFEEAAVLCLDGVGEWATTSVWQGKGCGLKPLWQIDFPHSLGLLYSAFTYYCGFKVNSGEYKLMGLAPYGEPKYVETIYRQLIDVKSDGSYHLNMEYFDYATGLKMVNSKFEELFGHPVRKPESELTQFHMDIARSIQVVTETIVLKLAETVQRETGLDNLCLAGGVALNCVANGRLQRNGPFKNIWIQPASGDAGGALGAALTTLYQYLKHPRNLVAGDMMSGAFLGPSYDNTTIQDYLDSIGAAYKKLDDETLYSTIATMLADNKVIGWFQGRMEYGPRALGGRSIIGDSRSHQMQTQMNLKIKYRESFRPFAPAIKYEKVDQWFDHVGPSPYMLLVANVATHHWIESSIEDQELFGIEKLKAPRSKVPAITHVDYSARIQTVHPETNPRFYSLLDTFEAKTGCPILVNTSFNVRGEPIVESPADAYQCFMRTEMDYLVLENMLLNKNDQPPWTEGDDWRNEFELD